MIVKKLLSFSLIISVVSALAQTQGTLTFTATTVNYPAPYSPKHILAIWVAQVNGTWVKTRKFLAQNPAYKQYLTYFKTATNSTYNSIDAITGPTLQTHQQHTVTWDCKDVNGNIVPDGNYRICIEFTSANATGKYYFLDWVKGPNAQTLTPADQPYFKSISLTWTPTTTNISENQPTQNSESYPNPFVNSIVINLPSENCDIEIFDVSGNLILSKKATGSSQFVWNGCDSRNNPVPNGLYYCVIQNGTKQTVKKVLKQ